MKFASQTCYLTASIHFLYIDETAARGPVVTMSLSTSLEDLEEEGI